MSGKAKNYMFSLSISITWCIFIQISETSGLVANKGDFSYQVSIKAYDSSKHYGSGALISDRWVLTAASLLTRQAMVYIEDITLIVGFNDLIEGTAYLVDGKIIHEFFDEQALEFDIALLRSRIKIRLNQYVQPIPYAKGEVNCEIDAVSVGFNEFDVMCYKNMTVLTNTGCDAILSGSTRFRSPTSMCAKINFFAPNGGECVFDHLKGTPIYTSDSRILFGIYVDTNYYENSGSSQYLYTRISEVADWIFTNTGVDGVNNL